MRAALHIIAAVIIGGAWGFFVGEVLIPDAHLLVQTVVAGAGGLLVGVVSGAVYTATAP